jgi:hypothetical protein
MTPPRPPLLATCMLRWLTASPHSEALEGDLLEAWRGSRSDAWYWRQVLIAVSPVRGISENRWVRLGATVATLAITALAALLIVTLLVLVVLANHERSWWPLVGTIVALLIAGVLPIGIALHRQRSSGQ